MIFSPATFSAPPDLGSAASRALELPLTSWASQSHGGRAENVHLPELDTLAELHAFLRPHAARAPLYLLYGEIERRLRPQFKILRTAAGAPEWREVVAACAVPGQWVLYRYRPRPSATPTGAPGN